LEIVREAQGSDFGQKSPEFSDLSTDHTVRALREIGKRLQAGESKPEIVKSFGLRWGRATQELREVVDLVEEQLRMESEDEEDDAGDE
jgi:hypothetical protein